MGLGTVRPATDISGRLGVCSMENGAASAEKARGCRRLLAAPRTDGIASGGGAHAAERHVGQD